MIHDCRSSRWSPHDNFATSPETSAAGIASSSCTESLSSMHVALLRRSLASQFLPNRAEPSYNISPLLAQATRLSAASFRVTPESTSYEDIWRKTAALSLLPGRRPSSSVRAVEPPQLSTVSDQREQQPEAAHGFLLRHIAGDGRCMFRAVVQGAHFVRAGSPTTPAKETELADELRKRVCMTLLESQEEIAPFIEGNFNEYVREMADVQTWGGEPELAIAAEVLQLPVTVYQREQGSADGDITETSTYGTEYKEKGAPSINVLFDGVGHYDLLLPSADAAGSEPVVSKWAAKSKL